LSWDSSNLYVSVFYHYLFIFLLYYLLLILLSRLLYICCRCLKTLMRILRPCISYLLSWNRLFLFWRALVSIVITSFFFSFIVQQSFQSLYKFSFLIFDFFFICIPWKIYIFSFSRFFRWTALISSCTLWIISWIKWSLFFEFIKSWTIFIVLYFWYERWLHLPHIFPIKSFEKWMIFYFMDSICS